MVLECRS
ncbi:hypothetical protein MTR67_011771 [Solanum verrucosum]|nr:hypothetical protein MTR67_011771 [Solanum verrucosum]